MSLRHFNGIMNRTNGLFFQRAGSTIPKLKGVKGGVIHCRRLPPSTLPAHADGGLVGIGKARNRVMTKRTRDRVVLG